MKGLILKDILQLKSYYKTLIIFMVIFLLVSIEQENTIKDGMIVMMMSLCFGMFGMATFSYDEATKANKYILTFPLTKKQIVLSKYILQIILTAVGTTIGTILSIILSLIFHNSIENIIDIISIAFGAILGIGLVQSIQIPCFYKYGTEKGRMYMFISIFIVAFGLGGVVTLGSKVIENYSINLSSVNSVLESYFPFIALLLIFIEYFISFKISYKMYSKKEF